MIGEVHEKQTLLIKATIKNQDNSIVDISDATIMKLLLQSPEGDKTEYDADFTSTGEDGKIQYSLDITVLDEVNRKHWEYQFKIVRPSGTYYTDIGSFEVMRNL